MRNASDIPLDLTHVPDMLKILPHDEVLWLSMQPGLALCTMHYLTSSAFANYFSLSTLGLFHAISLIDKFSFSRSSPFSLLFLKDWTATFLIFATSWPLLLP